MKTIQEIATELVALCREGNYNKVYEDLFHPQATSTEPEFMGNPASQVVGVEAIKQKGEEFNQDLVEMHSAYVSDALTAGNYITLTMGMDATFKSQGRVNMDEVIVYKVEDGKIVSEQFFY